MNNDILNKNLKADQDNRNFIKINTIIKQICEAIYPVIRTLGPKGATVLISKFSTKATKDGATVLKEIKYGDDKIDGVLDFVKDSINYMAKTVGDGTTTTTVLLRSMLDQSFKRLALNYDSVDIFNGIEIAGEYLKTVIPSMCKSITLEDEKLMAKVGTISANGEKSAGEILTRSIKNVGKYGVVNIDTSYSIDDTIREEYTLGMSLDSGYVSPLFCYKSGDVGNNYLNINEKSEISMKDPYIMICDKRLTSVNETLEMIMKFAFNNQRPMVLIAENIDGELLNCLVTAKIQNGFECVAVKAPGFGPGQKSMLEDLAILTGGAVISDNTVHNFQNLHKENINEILGSAEIIKVTQNKTIVINGRGNKEVIEDRVKNFEKKIEEMTKDGGTINDYEISNIRERLAKFKGGICNLKVGGANEADRSEKKDRLTDALYSINSAINHGITPGGGVSFLLLNKFLTEKIQKGDYNHCNPGEMEGIKIVAQALLNVLKTIIHNCVNIEAEVVIHELKNFYSNYTLKDIESIIKSDDSYITTEIKDNYIKGFNAYNNQYVDLLSSGIVNSAGVDSTCLFTAISIVKQFLRSEFVIYNKKM